MIMIKHQEICIHCMKIVKITVQIKHVQQQLKRSRGWGFKGKKKKQLFKHPVQ